VSDDPSVTNPDESQPPTQDPSSPRPLAAEEPPPFNVHQTLAHLTGTYARLDALRGRGQRREVAKELCSFFRQLGGDADFWNWLRGLEPADPQDRGEVNDFLADLSAFETRQAKLLTAMKVGEPQANTLAQVFTTNVYNFHGLLTDAAHMFSPALAAQSMQLYLQKISDAVCTDPTWANIAKAMGALGIIVSMVGAITLAASPAAVAVAVGALSLGAAALGYTHDRRRR
jgi:hypothetical protein